MRKIVHLITTLAMIININITLAPQGARSESDCDWPMFGRTQDGNRVAPDKCWPKENKIKLKWNFKTQGFIQSSPAITNNKILFGCNDKKVYCIDILSGQKLWELNTGDPVQSSPLINNNMVFVGSNNNYIYCINIETGIIQWQFKTKNFIQSSPIIYRGKIYFGSNDRFIYCLNESNGLLVWKYETDGIVQSSPVISNDRLFIGSFDGNLYCIDAGNGSMKWKFYTKEPIQSSPVIFNNNVIVYANDKKIYSLDTYTGNLVWDFTTSWNGNDSSSIIPVLSPCINNGLLYFGSKDRKVYCVDAKFGNLNWTFLTGGWVSSSPAVSNGCLFIGSNDKIFYQLNAITGEKITEYFIGDPIQSSPSISNDVIVVGSNNNKLFCFYPEPLKKETSDCDWPMYGNKSNNIRYSDCSLITKNDKIWEFKTNGKIGSTPAIISNVCYFTSTDGYLYAVDVNHGNKIWSTNIGASDSSPLVYGNCIYVGSSQNKFFSIDKQNGNILWSFDTGGNIHSSAIIDDGNVYFGAYDNNLYCIKSSNGSLVWKYKTGDVIVSSPTISEENIFFGSYDYYTYCLDKKIGSLVWKFKTAGWICSSITIYKNNAYVGSGYSGGYLYCLNANSGSLIWSNNIGKAVYSSAACLNGRVYIGAQDKYFYCFNSFDGKIIWKYHTGDILESSAAITSNGMIYFGSGDGFLYCLDSTTGKKVWDYKTGDKIYACPSLGKNYILCGSYDGKMYCFGDTDSNTTPPVINLLTPESASSSSPVSGSYNIEFTAIDDLGIEEATVNGVKAEFTTDSTHPEGYYFSTVQLKEGQNTFVIKAVDKSTNRNTSTLAITIYVHVTNLSKVEIMEPTLTYNADYSKWYQDKQNVKIDFKDIDFELPTINSNLSITKIEKFNKGSMPGYPDIPIFAVTYQIPKNLEYVSYELKYVETPFSLNGSLITPTLYQFPLPTGGKPYVLPDEDVYGSMTPFTKPDRHKANPLSSRKVTISPGVGGNPYKWPPELNFKDTNELILYIKPARYSNKKDEQTGEKENTLFYMSVIELDIKTDLKDKETSTGYIKPAFLNINEFYDMCIISNANLIGSQDGKMDDFADYARWKTENGVRTKCVDVNDILSSQGQNQESFMQIQSFIQKERELSGIKYVLLGGEDDVVPAAKVYAQAKSDKVDYRAMVASDVYYSQSTNDWGNVSFENLTMIGDLRKTIDIKPNVFVGRVPVETFEELKNFIGKMTGYSSFPYSDEYNKKVLLWGRHLYESSFGGDYLDHTARDLPSLGQNYIRLYDNAPESGEAFTKYESDDFAAGFIGRENPHVIAIDSHGSTSGIDSFSDNHVDKIKNSVPGCIMLSTSCNVAQFSKSKSFTSTLPDRFKDPCIAEKLLFKHDGGALAYIGNTSNGWFCPGYPDFSISSFYMKHIMKNIFKVDQSGQALTIGEVFWKAKTYCYSCLEEGVFDEYSWWVYNSLNLLGDPSFTPQILAKVDSLKTEFIESKVKGFTSFKLKTYSKECIELEILDTHNILWKLFPKEYGNLSVNGSVCSVIANRSDSKGFLIAFYRGLKAVIPLPHKESLKMIITPASVKLKLSGAPLKLEVKIVAENGNEVEEKYDVEWRIDKPEIGNIGKDGIFKPLRIGKCLVTAFCRELGLRSYLEIEVEN